MSHDWDTVDELIRELGAVRAASDASIASAVAKEAMSQAVREAGLAVSRTVHAPDDADAVSNARQSIRVARQVVGALDAEMARSRQLQLTAQALLKRAEELIAQARKAGSGSQ
jgi:hypothetical protein